MKRNTEATTAHAFHLIHKEVTNRSINNVCRVFVVQIQDVFLKSSALFPPFSCV